LRLRLTTRLERTASRPRSPTRLAQRYFDTSHAIQILATTVSEDLPEFDTAVRHLLQTVGDDT